MVGRPNFFGPAGSLVKPVPPITLVGTEMVRPAEFITGVRLTFDRPYIPSIDAALGFVFAGTEPPPAITFPHVDYLPLSATILQINVDWSDDPMAADMWMTYDPSAATEPWRGTDYTELEAIPWHLLGPMPPQLPPLG